MSLDEFLHNLHFDINKVGPTNWKVDWGDAPLTYKLYQELPVVPFSLELPLTLKRCEEPSKPDLNRIGHFLWYVYGQTQFSETVYSSQTTDENVDVMESFRRFVPSGGALYPNELYMYLKLEDLPEGIYHYDSAHHRLVLLRQGNFDSYLARALGNRCDLSSCFGTAFVSTMFWKNYYKYNNFSYRLQGLDAGVVIGQLLEVSKRFGFESGVYFQFLDRSINHLLGLSNHEESVYSVVPLSVEPTIWSTLESGTVSADELCQELPAIHPKHYVRSKAVLEYPMLTKINEASMFDSTESFRQIHWQKRIDLEGEELALPHVERQPYDLAEVSQQRFSPGMDFFMGKVSQQQLATLLQETMDSFSYRNDLDTSYEMQEPRVSLSVCLHNVEDIQDGAYYYDSSAHVLRLLNPGDQRLPLQFGLVGDNVNLYQVPLCVNIVGEKDHYKSALGYRGYRIQQMEAGMLLQKLLLTATSIGMGGHALLGFNVNLSDDIFKINEKGITSLIQNPIGPYQQRPWLRGSLRG